MRILGEIPDLLRHFAVGSFHAATVPSDRVVAESVHQECVVKDRGSVGDFVSGGCGAIFENATLAETKIRRGRRRRKARRLK